MRHPLLYLVGLLSLIVPLAARASDPPRFILKDGDLVVLIGDTLIEREQKYGYLETLLTIQNPGKDITFRNLGWSGDTVFGHARAGFGTQADGFKQLKDHVLALKPTVILVDYGMSDSFEGMEGLPKFREGLKALFDVFAQTKARVAVLSPIAHENLGKPFPVPTAHNVAIQSYGLELARAAAERGYAWVDLYHLDSTGDSKVCRPLTDDGLHPTPSGFWALAEVIDERLTGANADQKRWRVELDAHSMATANTTITNLERLKDGVRFRAIDGVLTPPPPPDHPGRVAERRTLRVAGLAPGRYALKVDGKPIASASAGEWNKGVALERVPEIAQVEALRKTINEKNLLYFYRWRPQNETYLFGFRKHEQGNNAREIPLFDPLVAEKEKEIARLRKPVPHVYELVRESEVSK